MQGQEKCTLQYAVLLWKVSPGGLARPLYRCRK